MRLISQVGSIDSWSIDYIILITLSYLMFDSLLEYVFSRPSMSRRPRFPINSLQQDKGITYKRRPVDRRVKYGSAGGTFAEKGH